MITSFIHSTLNFTSTFRKFQKSFHLKVNPEGWRYDEIYFCECYRRGNFPWASSHRLFFSKNKPRNTYRRDCYAFLSGNSWHFTHRRHFSQFLWKEKYLLRFPHIRKRLWRHTMWGKLLFLALKQMINVRYMRTKAPRVEFYIRDLVFNPMNGKFSIFFLLVFCFSFVVITIIVVVVVVLRQRNIFKLLIHLL